jgi:hypothetical protein
MVRAILDGRKTQTRRVVKPKKWMLNDWSGLACPYGAPGDRLWVRETFTCVAGPDILPGRVVYRADEPELDVRWTPSIHMPRYRSRILLEVEDVRAERLNHISGADAVAEGIEAYGQLVGNSVFTTFRDYLTGAKDRAARQSFETLWESINGPGSWAANPWVWVVEFRRLEGGAR